MAQSAQAPADFMEEFEGLLASPETADSASANTENPQLRDDPSVLAWSDPRGAAPWEYRRTEDGRDGAPAYGGSPVEREPVGREGAPARGEAVIGIVQQVDVSRRSQLLSTPTRARLVRWRRRCWWSASAQ